MKNASLLLILFFSFIIFSCTSEDAVHDLTSNKKISLMKPKMILLGPENIANPYDSLGRLHNEILEIYLTTSTGSAVIEDIMAQIQSIGLSNAINIVQDCSAPSSINIINTIINNPQNSATTIIENSILTVEAKIKITALLETLSALKARPYEDIYEFITMYESNILSNNLLNSEDKRILLTTSSIARYSIYYKKKKDRDWDTSIGSYLGAVVGALDSLLSPVIMALVTGITQNSLHVD